MSPSRILREVAALFFDDGHLALVIVALLVVTATALGGDWVDWSVAAVVLVGGVTIALVDNVVRTARRMRQPD